MKETDKIQNFRTENGDLHSIDEAGNHFINGKCANPKAGEWNVETGKPKKIGDTYPPMSERIFKDK